MAPALPIDARILGILGKFDPCQCFRISGFRNWEGLSPRFLKPEMQKVAEEQCTMYYSNLFVFVDALERCGDVAL